ncbi:MAG: cupin domain-containing protein [Alphaproteobacteria bacterium]|nr:cupin domain-containing protein [Alphaproteobacteria bacterium]
MLKSWTMALAAMIVSVPAMAGAKVVMKSDADILGNKISYPDGQAEITSVVAVQKPGECNGWHSHPVPTFGLVRKGELTVRYQNGDTKHLKAGDMLIEVQNMGHEGCNTGSEDLEVLVFYAGSDSVPNTIKMEDQRPH